MIIFSSSNTEISTHGALPPCNPRQGCGAMRSNILPLLKNHRTYPFFLGNLWWILREFRQFRLKRGLKLYIFSSPSAIFFFTQGSAYPFFLFNLWWILRDFRIKMGLKLCIFSLPNTTFSYARGHCPLATPASEPTLWTQANMHSLSLSPIKIFLNLWFKLCWALI